MKPTKILGAGGFGTVTDEGKYARKQLRELRHIIREVVMITYMQQSSYVVDIESYDLVSRTILIKKWPCSLRDCLIKYDLDLNRKLKIFHDVLCGLTHIHSAGIVHADITLSNILVNPKKSKACICDLGLSSITEYSRVDGTAPGYAPPVPVKSHGHDMFGLAISMLCMFGDMKLYKQKTSKELRSIVRSTKSIPDNVRVLLIEMCPDDLTKAITAEECLKRLYNETTSFELKQIDRYTCIVREEYSNYLFEEMKRVCETYKINRGLRCYKCILQFLSSPSAFSPEGYPLSPSYYMLYATSAILIYGALFGSSKLTLEACIEMTNGDYTEEDYYLAISKLIQSDNFIAMSLVSVK